MDIKNFDYADFDLKELSILKKKKNLKIAVAIPIKNESATIGKIISRIRNTCGDLIDDIAVFDSGSIDNSKEIVIGKGVPCLLDSDMAKLAGLSQSEWKRGKGFNLWASVLYFRKADIIVWVDGDLNFKSRHLYGVLGPLIIDDEIDFSKGAYLRPEFDNKLTAFLEPITGLLGGPFSHVNEQFRDPTCGLYAGRREHLEEIPFTTGYSVEMRTLIYSYVLSGPLRIAQVGVGKLENRDRPVAYMARMSAYIVRDMFNISKELEGEIIIDGDLPEQYIQWNNEKTINNQKLVSDIVDIRLPLVRDVLAAKQEAKKKKRESHYLDLVADIVKMPYKILIEGIIFEK